MGNRHCRYPDRWAFAGIRPCAASIDERGLQHPGDRRGVGMGSVRAGPARPACRVRRRAGRPTPDRSRAMLRCCRNRSGEVLGHAQAVLRARVHGTLGKHVVGAEQGRWQFAGLDACSRPGAPSVENCGGSISCGTNPWACIVFEVAVRAHLHRGWTRGIRRWADAGVPPRNERLGGQVAPRWSSFRIESTRATHQAGHCHHHRDAAGRSREGRCRAGILATTTPSGRNETRSRRWWSSRSGRGHPACSRRGAPAARVRRGQRTEDVHEHGVFQRLGQVADQIGSTVPGRAGRYPRAEVAHPLCGLEDEPALLLRDPPAASWRAIETNGRDTPSSRAISACAT